MSMETHLAKEFNCVTAERVVVGGVGQQRRQFWVWTGKVPVWDASAESVFL